MFWNVFGGEFIVCNNVIAGNIEKMITLTFILMSVYVFIWQTGYKTTVKIRTRQQLLSFLIFHIFTNM